MKYLIVAVLVAFLTACGPAAEPEPPVEPVEVEQVQPNSPLPAPVEPSLPNSPIVTPASSGDTRDVPAIEPVWPVDPNQVIVSATFCCGFTTPLVPRNYIAEATIWGDGRIVWVTYEAQGQRQVWQGMLTSAQMEAFLQQAIDAGFFSWEERYADQTIADAADQCLTINLTGQTKQVCQYVQGAPAAFATLYQTVAAGAGATGTPYLPENGYLQATVLELPADSNAVITAEWPADQLGFSLSEAPEGRWVEGEILRTAWEIVNANWQGMLVQEGETVYEISVQLTDVSLIEPPISK